MGRKLRFLFALALALGLLLVLPSAEASGHPEAPALRLRVVPPDHAPVAAQPLRVQVIVEASPEVRRWPLLVTAHAEGETLQPALGRHVRSGAKATRQQNRSAEWPWRIAWPLLARRAGAGIVRFTALGYACGQDACRAVRAEAELSLRVR